MRFYDGLLVKMATLIASAVVVSPYLSVANCSLAMAVRSSVEVAAEPDPYGVAAKVDPGGLEVVEEVAPAVFAFAACFAAFSANLFCFDVEGGMTRTRAQ